MTAFYSVLMVLNLVCMLTILLSGLDRGKPFLLTLALFNAFLFLFNWCSLELLSEQNARQAIEISRYHLACIFLGYPFLVYIFGAWTEFRYTQQAVVTVAVISIPLLFINVISENSIRYGSDVNIVEYITLFGDTAYLLVGESNRFSPLIVVGYGLVTLFLVYTTLLFFHKRRNRLSIVLVISIGLHLVAAFIGSYLDTYQSFWVYMGGVPMTLLSLFVLLSISRGLREKTVELEHEIAEKNGIYSVFANLARISFEDEDSDFYQQSLDILSRFTRAKYVMFGLVEPRDPNQITTVVMLKNGQQVPNFTYARQGTPCENVLSRDVCVYPSRVARDFPEDIMLAEEGIEGYIGYPVSDEHGTPIGLLVLLFDKRITAERTLRTVGDVFATRIGAELRREKLQGELRAAAYRDYLTRLPNRNELLNIINQISLESVTTEQRALLLMIDLDHFGEINAKFGYEIGDQIIQCVGERLQNYADEGVFVARVGGNEFAVVIYDVQSVTQPLATVHWTAIRALLIQTIIIGSRKINLTFTMGAVAFPSQIDSNTDVIGCAEHAIMQAKSEGRDCLKFFDPELLSRLNHVRDLESALSKAIDKNQGLFVNYQPKVEKSGRLVGAEALLRWVDDEIGFVSPAEFIPIAEKTGLIHKLGKWVLREVIGQVRHWQSVGYNLIPVSINIAASQFDDENFADTVINLVKELDVDARLIDLELTESALLTDLVKVVSTLSALRREGFTISLDDFGTGYSSLSYLSQLPLDALKIDKSFIDGLGDNRNRELVRSIIAISHVMGLTNIAEGTETLEQVEVLDEFGCEYFQGYYFSKPLPVADFEVLMTNINLVSVFD